MTNDFCPKCNALRNVMSNTSESIEKNADGETFKVITTSFSCNTCHSFVKSETKKIPLSSEEVKELV